MRASKAWLLRGVSIAACALTFAPRAALAQLPTIKVSDSEPTVFEGNPGGFLPVTAAFTVKLSAVSAQDVTFLFSTFTFSNPAAANSGSSCKQTGVDFIGIANKQVTIPANTDPPEVDVLVTICPDTFVETDESFGVRVSEPINAFCDAGIDCLSQGHIADDDGPPFVRSIIGPSVREPLQGSKLATFTVSLSHPHPGFEVRVNWSTRDGTAIARPGSCGLIVIGGGGLPDYLGGSGTLIFSPGVLSQTLTVTVCADSAQEPTETFLVVASGGMNVSDGNTGTGFILDFDRLVTGDFTLNPDAGDVHPNEWLDYQFKWTLTSGVWRDLKSLELRLRDPETGRIPLWVRWLESGNTFQLCEVPGHTDEDGDANHVNCGAAERAGTSLVLNAPLASLDVSSSKSTGSGPTGPSVTLDLRVSFKKGAVKGTYDVEVASETDAGLRDDFAPGGMLTIKR